MKDFSQQMARLGISVRAGGAVSDGPRASGPVVLGSSGVYLSVVVPMYNEASRGLAPRLEELGTFLCEHYPSHELILVDDGSTDDTARVAESARGRARAFCLLKLGVNRGKGAAVREGMLATHGRRVAFLDADLATPLRELPAVLGAVERGAGVAIGSRGLPESVLLNRESAVRTCCGRLFNRLAQLLLAPGVRDTQCGFKVLDGALARSLAPAMLESRFGFDVEMLYLAAAAGFPAIEIPVCWDHQPCSRVHFLKDGMSMVSSLIRVWWRARTGQYRPAVALIRDAGASGPPAQWTPRQHGVDEGIGLAPDMGSHGGHCARRSEGVGMSNDPSRGPG